MLHIKDSMKKQLISVILLGLNIAHADGPVPFSEYHFFCGTNGDTDPTVNLYATTDGEPLTDASDGFFGFFGLRTFSNPSGAMNDCNALATRLNSQEITPQVKHKATDLSYYAGDWCLDETELVIDQVILTSSLNSKYTHELHDGLCNGKEDANSKAM